MSADAAGGGASAASTSQAAAAPSQQQDETQQQQQDQNNAGTAVVATTTSNDSAQQQQQQAPRFEIKKWSAVAMWKWDIQVDVCCICRCSLMSLCISCETSHPNATMEECNIAWGVCGHSYHCCCIRKWVRTRNVCPLDNREWEVQKIGR